MKDKEKIILQVLDEMYPNATCELEYHQDYELLISTVLSAQCTDKRVNEVARKLWSIYDLKGLMDAPLEDIEEILRPLGSYTKKAFYIQSIARCLLLDFDGSVPNDRVYLEGLPGVGRKTCNVVLSNLYHEPLIAVDTHVERVSKRLRLAYFSDDVFTVEKKLMKKFPRDRWSLLHHQMVLFGRYHCKAVHPLCENCPLKELCGYFKKNRKLL